MKFIVALFALVAIAIAAPVQESQVKPAIPFDSASANLGVIGKVQTAGNTYGDIVTLGVNAQVGIEADVKQDIVNVILALLNNQNGNGLSVDPAKLQGIVSLLQSKLEKN